jgi:hypothetical protein
MKRAKINFKKLIFFFNKLFVIKINKKQRFRYYFILLFKKKFFFENIIF